MVLVNQARFPAAELGTLRARVEQLETERRRLLMIIELLRELAGSLNYRDIVHAVARRVGYALELDRCSVFLTEKGGGSVHLVASYEDPSLRSQVVDLADYPELRQALDSGEIVNIPDVIHEPALEPVQDMLATRRVQSITVVPVVWRRVTIGAIFLRTDRTRPPLSPPDIQWAKLVADVTARALRTAHRFERLQARQRGSDQGLEKDRERAAMIAFLSRLLTSFTQQDQAGLDDLLPRTSKAELDRLAGVALTVLTRDSKG
ncbi:MAG: GAF domain-containing protein [Gemmatimonadales bacterium]|nr:GAF domain-containing protein [Gemmatimonadales bacterium]